MRVVCIGDSVTYGQNVRASEAWPAVLERLTGHDVRNAGVCGDTTRLALERFPKDVQLHKPDVVVLQFGHNDANCWETDGGPPRVSPEAFVGNLIDMVDRVTALKARCWVLHPHDALADFNDRLGRYRPLAGIVPCATLALPPADITLLDDGYGVHPDPAMHERYARLVADAL